MLDTTDKATWTLNEARSTISDVHVRYYNDPEFRNNAYTPLAACGPKSSQGREQEILLILSSTGRLSPADQAVLLYALIDIVETDEPDPEGPAETLWGLALDTIFAMAKMEDWVRIPLLRTLDESVIDTMREEANLVALPALETFLRAGGFKQPDRVVGCLLRAAYRPALDTYIDYIDTFRSHDPACGRHLVAPLARLDADMSIRMGAEILAQFPPGQPHHYVLCEDSVEQFLVPFLKLDPALIARLVEETRRLNPEAGRALAKTFLKWLSDSWIRARYGAETTARVHDIVLGQLSAMNEAS